MKRIYRLTALALIVCSAVALTTAQDNGVVRKRTAKDAEKRNEVGVTERMHQFYQTQKVDDADLTWMKIIYRELDLNKEKNAPLYFPEERTENEQNLIRIIMGLVADNKIPVYEYLDGREIFTDQYRVKVGEMLDRFSIYYKEAKGSTDKNPKYTIEESDVPSGEVKSYYVIERWEFDRRNTRLKPNIVAICPVIHREGDFGSETLKYPMFWVKFDDIRPYLAQQYILTDNFNNLQQYNYDDYFTLQMYDGDIYKTKNLQNKSMMQLFPDPDDRKRAQDSIDLQIKAFDKKLWVPTEEELEKIREAKEASDSTNTDVKEAKAKSAKKTSVRSNRSKRGTSSSSTSSSSKSKATKSKTKSSSSSSSSAARSVRRTRR